MGYMMGELLAALSVWWGVFADSFNNDIPNETGMIYQTSNW